MALAELSKLQYTHSDLLFLAETDIFNLVSADFCFPFAANSSPKHKGTSTGEYCSGATLVPYLFIKTEKQLALQSLHQKQ